MLQAGIKKLKKQKSQGFIHLEVSLENLVWMNFRNCLM